MKPKVLFIGSIGTIAETSELQRQAYNEAFQENGVSWNWNPEVYKQLLKSNGGQDRLDTLATATGQQLSDEKIKQIHSRKTEIAGEKIVNQNITPRAGIKELITEAKKDGTKIAWVTTTSKENTDAILKAFNGTVSESDLDYIFHREDAKNGKPSSDIYNIAMSHFKAQPSECIAVEDSLNSVLAAKNTGIFSVVTPGENHKGNVGNVADLKYDSLAETNWDSLKKAFEQSKNQKNAA